MNKGRKKLLPMARNLMRRRHKLSKMKMMDLMKKQERKEMRLNSKKLDQIGRMKS